MPPQLRKYPAYLAIRLGILEDQKLEHVPGTAPLQDLRQTFDSDAHVLMLDATGQIVLVPQL